MSWVEKTFDLKNNYQSLAIGSHLNANVVLRFEKDFIINKKQYLYAGFGLDHISNAAFKMPNLGLNFISLRLGYNFCTESNKIDTIFDEIKYKSNLNFQINFASGIKENNDFLQKKYIIHEFSTQLGYRKGDKSNIISGLDFLYNPSVEFFTNKKIQLGSYVGHLLHLDKLKIGVIMGAYIFNKKFKNENLYHKIFVEYDFNNKINGRLTLKSHWAKADFLGIGIGYKIF